MKRRLSSSLSSTLQRTPLWLCAAFLSLLATPAAHAQQRAGVRAAPPPRTAQSVAPISRPVLPGAPSANGLASPFPPSVTPPSVPGTSTAGGAAVGESTGMNGTATAPAVAGTAGATVIETPPSSSVAVTGAGAYGSRGAVRPMPAGPINDVDIARSFLNADTDHDGELTRGEAARLSLLPLTFEEMDANHDDILTRSEYEAAVR
ncbi:MAG TPA: EF-hand domain-containing protein [Ramlibacter sp.]|uniref:EF-hand domain-containing protein n=1 Tax=Ramlibacter sp. TaxID=1917967 RepID=UPI002C8200CD|nr:EF-hand domain-containing protein [Ramlibacter sp.]HVZ42553.1 EF-hand domain-containing protein [Ramlibacter sp.]